jgi:hypothetical protein
MGQIPDAEVIVGDQSNGIWFDRSNSVMTVSDQTGDGVADIITLLLDPDIPVLKVWTCEPDPDNVDPDKDKCIVSQATTVELTPQDMDTDTHVNPIVVPVDVDNDDVVMFRYTGEYFVDFTAPTVIAALAAPPCELGIGQNVEDYCTTTWGSSSSTTLDQTFSATVFGSVSFGVAAYGLGAKAEAKATIGAAVSYERSRSYELTTGHSFTTGPLEDSVVFTSIPLDRYTYEIITSNDPNDIGNTITIDLPRDIVMLMTEVDYYNQNIQPDALHIDERVFDHSPGQIDSYPSAVEKDLILIQQRDLVQESRDNDFFVLQGQVNPLEALPGLEVGPISVGEGTGGSALSLEYVETKGNTGALELSFEYENEGSAGVLVGYKVGLALGSTISLSHGDSSIYEGTVGSIEPDNFSEQRYTFGMFTYLQALEGLEFEVVNYWVEQ